jgi:hypothetical protein
VKRYLATLDDAALGAASDVTPKFVSPTDPAAQWTGAMRGPAFFGYADNYLIDVKFGIIMDVEASRAIRQAEVGAAKTMIERTGERFGLKPERLAADTACGSAANLNWPVNEKKIAPHVPVIDKSNARTVRFSRRFHLRQGARHRHRPGGQSAHDDWQDRKRRSAAVQSEQARLRCVPGQERCWPKEPARKVPRAVGQARSRLD